MDSVLVVQECIHSKVLSKKPGILLKLDMEKAYDRVEWGILLEILRAMSFSDKWKNWIRGCLSLGGKSRFFSGFMIPDSNIVISHIQYADDTLIFFDAESAQVSNIARFLEICDVTLGLKVNFHKSSLVGINVEADMISELAILLGCKVGSFPITYLGLLISYSRLTITIWDIVLKRVQRKLALWKHKYLSIKGRVTLLRTSLANLLVYQMSLIHIPASVAKRLEKMMRDLLWGATIERRKFHLLRWDKVCSPKKEGGLDIRKIFLQGAKNPLGASWPMDLVETLPVSFVHVYREANFFGGFLG
ncbi:uncharacterized protein LOC105420276 [Amborella trichopoda]|uniref:uncharacterized protein LOC105420276 n=1 Tax=Amborella trichopoda TaxID=13333 RepID=UPI0005D44C78|nr:uncharacterized protein LOC105420276 [Amborella trichopoda]|eukprot:XP_011621700.1 uncharacterized protein LOC105420276 [Amborella trichopoda]